jgi:hypothetical protein
MPVRRFRGTGYQAGSGFWGLSLLKIKWRSYGWKGEKMKNRQKKIFGQTEKL